MKSTLTARPNQPSVSQHHNWDLNRPLQQPSDAVRNFLADPIGYLKKVNDRPSLAYLDFTSLTDKNLLESAIKEDPNCLLDAQFIYSDLSNIDLSGANLRGANFFKAKLNGTKLNRIMGTNLCWADLRGSDLSNPNTLKFADLIGAVIDNTTQLPEDFSVNKFVALGGRLSWSTNSSPSDTQAVWKEYPLRTLLPDKILKFLRKPEDSLTERPSLAHFDFSAGKAKNVLEQALKNHPLLLRGTDLRGANLAGWDLSGCDLSGADLSGADLTGANLKGANLYGATLDDETKIKDSVIDQHTQLPNNYTSNIYVIRGGIFSVNGLSVKNAPATTEQISGLQNKIYSFISDKILSFIKNPAEYMSNNEYVRPSLACLNFSNNRKAKYYLEKSLRNNRDFLAGSDLRGAKLANMDLRKINLKDAQLEGAKLFGARLHGATNLPWNKHTDRFRYIFCEGINRETRRQLYRGDCALKLLSNTLEVANHLFHQALGLNR